MEGDKTMAFDKKVVLALDVLLLATSLTALLVHAVDPETSLQSTAGLIVSGVLMVLVAICIFGVLREKGRFYMRMNVTIFIVHLIVSIIYVAEGFKQEQPIIAGVACGSIVLNLLGLFAARKYLKGYDQQIKAAANTQQAKGQPEAADAAAVMA